MLKHALTVEAVLLLSISGAWPRCRPAQGRRSVARRPYAGGVGGGV
jgi:hypothetical protein